MLDKNRISLDILYEERDVLVILAGDLKFPEKRICVP
jgi:hypothetical protein